MLFVVAVPRGVPGNGPDGHFPQEIEGLGSVTARIPEVICILYFYLSPRHSCDNRSHVLIATDDSAVARHTEPCEFVGFGVIDVTAS